jgi:hypothetical protein
MRTISLPNRRYSRVTPSTFLCRTGLLSILKLSCGEVHGEFEHALEGRFVTPLKVFQSFLAND